MRSRGCGAGRRALRVARRVATRANGAAPATPGSRSALPEPNFDEPDETSWFEQWEYMATRRRTAVVFADLLHPISARRATTTPRSRTSSAGAPSATARTRCSIVDWRGMRVDGEAHRWGRTGELRVYPRRHRRHGRAVVPRLGSHYNDDTGPNDLFFTRRYGGGGDVRLRPDGFGYARARTAHAALAHGPTRRAPARTRHLPARTPTKSAPARERALPRPHPAIRPGRDDARRAARRRIPRDIFTGVLDLSAGSDSARTSRSYLVSDAPRTIRPTCGPDRTRRQRRSSSFQTRSGDRIARSVAPLRARDAARGRPTRRASPRTGGARVRSAWRSSTTTTSTRWRRTAAPTCRSATGSAFDSFGSWALRKNEIRATRSSSLADNRTQLGPFLRACATSTAVPSYRAEPIRGHSRRGGVARARRRSRSDYADTVDAAGFRQPAIRPDAAVVSDETSVRTIYLRSSARLMRRSQLSAEAGIRWCARRSACPTSSSTPPTPRDASPTVSARPSR